MRSEDIYLTSFLIDMLYNSGGACMYVYTGIITCDVRAKAHSYTEKNITQK